MSNNAVRDPPQIMYHIPDTHHTFHPRRPLSSNGPYQDYSAAMAALIPGVDRGDPKNRQMAIEWRPASVTMLNLKENAKPYCREFGDKDSLQAHFERRLQAGNPSSNDPPERRIYILEGLNTDYISTIGGFFYLDPLLFATHEQTSIWEKSHFGARMTECLPTVAASMSHFCIPYFEMMYFKEPIGEFQINCRATGRHVGVTRIAGKFEQEVVVRRKCSYWDRLNSDGGWDVVILTDPPIKEVSQNRQTMSMPNTPFQRGYLDFLPRGSVMKNIPSGPPRTSMRDDLVYYWTTHQALFPKLESPAVAKVFIRKIAASHYMQLHLWTRSVISSQEWHLSRRNNLATVAVDFVEEQWSDLQASNRRCVEYCDDVERIILTLGNEPVPADFGFSDHAAWMDSKWDFQLIYERLKGLKGRYEVLLGSITALAGIVGNRQSLAETKRSFREAKNVKILTLIGMVFIPLAFICGLFSMNDNFLPGSSEFWVYWVTAVPLILLVFLVSVVANWGYDDNAGTWNTANIWRSARVMIGGKDTITP